MHRSILLAITMALTGCGTSMWNEGHGKTQLPLYSANSIGHDFDLSGNDIEISNVVDDFGTIHWNAEVSTEPYKGSYRCYGNSTYEGLLKQVVCTKN